MKKGHKFPTPMSRFACTRLIDEYLTVYSPEEIRESLLSAIQSLGAAKTGKLLAAFAADEVREVVRTLLVEYYDPLYGYENAEADDYDFKVDAEDLSCAAAEIIGYLIR